jgi:hypothetical protein
MLTVSTRREDCAMLVDRNDAIRVSGDFDAATDSWWQKRSHPAHTWLRRAVASAITVSMSGAATSFTTNQLCVNFAEVRWKRFLLRASR